MFKKNDKVQIKLDLFFREFIFSPYSTLDNLEGFILNIRQDSNSSEYFATLILESGRVLEDFPIHLLKGISNTEKFIFDSQKKEGT